MPNCANDLGQPIGAPVGNWQPPPQPARQPMAGRFCRIEPLIADQHGTGLHTAMSLEATGALWTYLPYGPFTTRESFNAWLVEQARSQDPLFFAIIDQASGKATGLASYLRIDPGNGCIEAGHILYSPLLQRTAAATEAMFLMMRRAFQLGYRRYEWKCDALNAKSRAAAERLGFTFEGIFRQAIVYKGRNRDTAWYSIIDSEWPRLEQAFLRWLEPSNFDAAGCQVEPLAKFKSS